MKVILIEEDRFKEICDKLKHETEKLIQETDNQIEKTAIAATHRNMHYHLVSWMQSHGASCV